MFYRKLLSLLYRVRAFFYRRSAAWAGSQFNVSPPAPVDPGTAEQVLAASGCRLRDFHIDIHAFEAFKREMMFPALYAFGCRDKKLLEHFISFSLLKPGFGDTYIDVGSQDSPFPEALLRRHVNAFSQDLAYRAGIHRRRIGSGADRIPIPDGSVDCISLQCTFEHFNGKVDMLFMKELQRILRPQGKCCIVPLYLTARLVNYIDPLYDRTDVLLDPDADIVGEIHLGGVFERTYSPDAFVRRVIASGRGLTYTLYRIHGVDAVSGSPQVRRVQYALLAEKNAAASAGTIH